VTGCIGSVLGSAPLNYDCCKPRPFFSMFFFLLILLETATTISLALGEVATVANLAIALKKDSSQRNQHHRTSHACGMPWRLNRRLRWYHVRRVPGSWKASLEDARVTRPSRATTWSSPRRRTFLVRRRSAVVRDKIRASGLLVGCVTSSEKVRPCMGSDPDVDLASKDVTVIMLACSGCREAPAMS
jgi:hypothetical protein